MKTNKRSIPTNKNSLKKRLPRSNKTSSANLGSSLERWIFHIIFGLTTIFVIVYIIIHYWRYPDTDIETKNTKKENIIIPQISEIASLEPLLPAYKPNQQPKTYIEILPTKYQWKIGIKQDRRVVFGTEVIFDKYERESGDPSGILGRPKSLVTVENILQKHPLTQATRSTLSSLEKTMIYLQQTEQCKEKPIFLSMANAGDSLYWQLVENFVYTMAKFGISDCAMVICVTDPKCMQLCKDSFFPCFDYGYENQPIPSVMEQIATVKLLHIPKALSQGVSVFMLDLDVGFLANPMHMVKVFQENVEVDIFVQEDYLFIMNRTKAGWKQWYTEPLPNIGLFLVRGNEKTSDMFTIAWERYLKWTDPTQRDLPGKDQNHVLEAMRIGRGKFGLKYAYFSNDTAPLLDKMCQHKSRNTELGGLASLKLLTEQQSIAMHTTCYEKSTKVMGLKATNAFWNPKYYDNLRPTLTKQLIYINDEQLLQEVQTLVWLAMRTNRALIIPNILGPDDHSSIEPYGPNNLKLWPGFRVIHFKRAKKGDHMLQVDVLEPAFYWRLSRDYDIPPVPKLVAFDHESNPEDIYKNLDKEKSQSRIILHGTSEVSSNLRKVTFSKDIISKISAWSDDSVGWTDTTYSLEAKTYVSLPSIKKMTSKPFVNDVIKGMRTCMKIFGPPPGNRTCFQICD